MPIFFWSVILGSAAAVTVVLNRRKRKKFASLAAHMTQSGVRNPSLGAKAADNTVGLATGIQYTKSQ